jgi:F-type H+-transporting ATPase subunit epsilon
MATATQFDVIIVSPDQTLFEGQAVKLMAPTITQDIAILPDHTPLYAQLKPGPIIITDTLERTHQIDIEGGIIRVKRNRVSIIAGFDILRH